MLQKVRKQGNWDERTFWHEMVYKSLIPTFGPLQYICLPKVGSVNLVLIPLHLHFWVYCIFNVFQCDNLVVISLL